MITKRNIEGSTVKRLAGLKDSADCVPYCESVPMAGPRARWISIYGICSTGEILVEITDQKTTRVQSFVSRHKNCPPEVRRKDMPLVDTADAFALARTMCRRWPEQSTRSELPAPEPKAPPFKG
jgi:hypothetical protein